MKAFRIKPAESPIAVVHYTKTDRKFVMEASDLPLTAKSFSKFLKAVISAKRGPTSDPKAAYKARKKARAGDL